MGAVRLVKVRGGTGSIGRLAAYRLLFKAFLVQRAAE